MKILFSINFKFYDETAVNLINFIKENDKNKTIDGFEAVFDIEDNKQIEYIKQLTFLCQKNNYHLQFHGNNTYELEIQKKYLDFINKISEILEKKISVVIHPQSSNTLEEEIEKSNLYFSEILNYIYENNYNIEISVENLNSVSYEIRLSKNYLKSILSNNMDLNFTYDLGHEIMEYGELTDLDDLYLERLSNVHIHTFDNTIEHLPINETAKNKEKWIKAIQYLKYINYDKTFVLEYDFYRLGEEYYERLLNYIKCAEFMYDYIGGNL